MKLMHNDPRNHPPGEERVGRVGNRLLFIHAAQVGTHFHWIDRVGNKVTPTWVRTTESLTLAIEFATYLETGSLPRKFLEAWMQGDVDFYLWGLDIWLKTRGGKNAAT